jgi:hypothetical protein
VPCGFGIESAKCEVGVAADDVGAGAERHRRTAIACGILLRSHERFLLRQTDNEARLWLAGGGLHQPGVAADHYGIGEAHEQALSAFDNAGKIEIIGGHHVDEVAGGESESPVKRYQHAHIFLVAIEACLRDASNQTLDNFHAVVGRAVVDNNDFIVGNGLASAPRNACAICAKSL